MNNEQNRFYTSISKYYADIFPYNPAQMQFVKNKVGELQDKNILDIGCATGELAFNLAKDEAKIIGIDLNKDLLEQAVSNKNHPDLTFQHGNMLELQSDFSENQFDAVLCFGNTLVHLETIDLIQQMLKGVFVVLKPGGKFLLQILNYDYILADQVSTLPLIETDNIRFVRNYVIEKNNPLIRFQTNLEIKKEKQLVSNETLLFALKSSELIILLKTSGFQEVELFSNFKQDPFGGKHLPLVASCKK